MRLHLTEKGLYRENNPASLSKALQSHNSAEVALSGSEVNPRHRTYLRKTADIRFSAVLGSNY